MKACKECKIEKSEDNFKKYKRHGIIKLSGICKSCSSMERKMANKATRQANPICNFCSCSLTVDNWTDHMRKESQYCCLPCHKKRPSQSFESNKNSALIRKYGITLEDFNNIKLEQSNSCAICKKSEVFSTRPCNKPEMNLAVDHCHSTGKVRGLLCLKCNRALGLFEENIENLNEAIAYVNKHKA